VQYIIFYLLYGTLSFTYSGFVPPFRHMPPRRALCIIKRLGGIPIAAICLQCNRDLEFR
jgi:hypothetical protein